MSIEKARRGEFVEQRVLERIRSAAFSEHAERIIRSNLKTEAKKRKLQRIPNSFILQRSLEILDLYTQEEELAEDIERSLLRDFCVDTKNFSEQEIANKLGTNYFTYLTNGEDPEGTVGLLRSGPLMYFVFTSSADFTVVTGLNAGGTHHWMMNLKLPTGQKRSAKVNCVMAGKDVIAILEHEYQHFTNRMIGVVSRSPQDAIKDEVLAFMRDESAFAGNLTQHLNSKLYTKLMDSLVESKTIVTDIQTLLVEIKGLAQTLGCYNDFFVGVVVYAIADVPLEKIPQTLRRMLNVMKTNPSAYLQSLKT